MEFIVKRRFASFHKAESLVPHCIYFDLPPLLSGKDAEFDGKLVHTTWQREARFGWISGDEELLLLSRSGCGKKKGRLGSGILRGDLLTATCGDPQRRRAHASVIHGQRGHSALGCCLLHSFFNLQARVPLRRPCFSSATASFVSPSPSGCVPGDGAGGRCVELLTLGGEGLDCTLCFSAKVLFVKARGLDVIFLFFEVLDVICIPTV